MKKIIFYTTFILSLASFAVNADEVQDAINQASSLYKSGQTQQAVTQLEYAAQLIREQRGNDLAKFLPQPLSGWQADEVESEAAGAAMFGGGIMVSRHYYNDEKDVNITIAADSPMIQTVMMMISNPMMFQGSGAKMKMVKGHQVIYNDDGAMTVINNRFLIQVESPSQEQIMDSDVVAFVNAIDFAGIANYK